MAGAAFWSSAANEGPLYSRNPWYTLKFDGFQLPGECEVKGLAQLELGRAVVVGIHRR